MRALPISLGPPLRVLRVITTLEPEVGGPSYSAVNAAVAEQAAGIATTIASTTSAGVPCYTPPSLMLAGVAHRSFLRPRIIGDLGKRWGISVRYALWILRHARRYDVVHVHYVWSLGTAVGILAGMLWGRPVVMTPHESLTTFDIDNSRSRLRQLQKVLTRRLLLAGVDCVVLASALEKRDSHVEAHRCRVIQHPVFDDADPPVDSSQRGPGGPRIGFLGRLHPKKRIDDLIVAFARMNGDATLVIGGNQPLDQFARLRDRVADQGLAARVRLLGFVAPDDRGAFFSSIDVLVMPSSYECFGMVAAEALCAGVPVIVTELTGIAEVVRDHNAGFVVPVGSPAAIRDAIDRMLVDPLAHAMMQANALEAASARLSFGAYAQAVRAVYDEVIA